MSRISRTRLRATVSVTVVTWIELLETLAVAFFEMLGKLVTERTALCFACLVEEAERVSMEVCPIARVAKTLTRKALLGSMVGMVSWRQNCEDLREDGPTVPLERKWLEQETSSTGPGSLIKAAVGTRLKKVLWERKTKTHCMTRAGSSRLSR